MKPAEKKLFPQKLWDLIHDERFNFCLRWSQDGQRIFLERDEFEENYLRSAENQFHTQNILSFVRQMNLYGFKKVDECYYENDYFKRDCHNLLKFMARHPPARPTSMGNRANNINQWDMDNLSSPDQMAPVASGSAQMPGGDQLSSMATSPMRSLKLVSPGGEGGSTSGPVDYSKQSDKNSSRRKQQPVKFVSHSGPASSVDSFNYETTNLKATTTTTTMPQQPNQTNLKPSLLDATSLHNGLDQCHSDRRVKRRAKSDLTPQSSNMSLESAGCLQYDLFSGDAGPNEPNIVQRNKSVPSTLNEQPSQPHGIQPAPPPSYQAAFMDQEYLTDSLKILLENLRRETQVNLAVDQLVPPSMAGGSSGEAASSNLSPSTSNSGPSTSGFSSCCQNRTNPDTEFNLDGPSSAPVNIRHRRANDSRSSLESYLNGFASSEPGGSMPDTSITGPSGLGFPKYKRGVEALDDDDHDICRPSSNHDAQGHNCNNRTRKSSYRRSSSSLSFNLLPQSRRLEELQDEEQDPNDFVLDLAKPKVDPSSIDKKESASGGTN